MYLNYIHIYYFILFLSFIIIYFIFFNLFIILYLIFFISYFITFIISATPNIPILLSAFVNSQNFIIYLLIIFT